MFSFNPELAMTDAYEDGDEAFDSYSRNEDEADDADVRTKYVDILNKKELLCGSDETTDKKSYKYR